jgi:hypothetical protein
MASPQPVFVIGRNRSGTKWLSNILANHEAVAAVQHPKGSWSGIVSTNLFDHFPRVFGDLRNNENRAGFLACFAETNFFRYCGLPRSILFEQRHDDYLDYFDHLMSRLASDQGRGYWLQKAPSLVLPRLLARFPEARFVVIRRTNVLDNIRSSLALHQKSGAKPASPIRISVELGSYYLHRAIEQRYVGSPNFMLVEFESLKTDPAATVENVCRYLGLDYWPEMLEVGYEANSSFSGRTRPQDVISRSGLALFRLLEPVARRIPGSLLRGLHRMREKASLRRFSAPRFIRGTFRSFRAGVEGDHQPLPVPSERGQTGQAEYSERRT